MGKRMQLCFKVAKATSELALGGLSFQEALEKAKEMYNFHELSVKEPEWTSEQRRKDK